MKAQTIRPAPIHLAQASGSPREMVRTHCGILVNPRHGTITLIAADATCRYC